MGGYELRAQNILNGLKRRGHKVFVLTSTYGINKISIKNGVYRVFSYKHKFPVSFMETILKDIKETIELKKVIKKLEPDVIYIFNMRFLSKTLLKKAYLLKIPIVYDIADYWFIDNGLYDRWLSYWQYSPRFFITRRIKLKLSGLVTKLNIESILPTDTSCFDFKYMYFISNFIKNIYLKNGFGVKEAQVFYHHGLKINLNTKTEFVPLSPPVKLLYVGAVIKNKGVHTIINALPTLKQKGCDCNLSIIGGTFDKEYLKGLKLIIEREKLSVSFVGQYPHNKVLDMYKNYDILVFSSIWDEPFGRVIVEGMSGGLVVVATGTGGSKEILNDGENCLLFTPDDSEDLAKKIEMLIKRPELYKKVVRNGINFVKDFDSEDNIEKNEKYLNGVIKDYKTKLQVQLSWIKFSPPKSSGR